MRHPEDKIQAAILHPDPAIRDRAVSYFAKSSRPDATAMPLVIRAVETYGRNDAYRVIGLSRDLPQSDESVTWVIDELNDEPTGRHENYAYNLSMVLLKADPALLLPREAAILEARHFLPELRVTFTERLRMLSWDAATCWRRLVEFSEESKDKQYTNDVNLGHAHRVVEALARHGTESEEQVHAVLQQKVEDVPHHPMHWLVPLVVRLAGRVQLDSAIPLIVAKLLEDGGDLLNEECAAALIRIGTPDVLHAVAGAFPTAPHHFRLYAGGPLERIHSDLAVETCLRLLRSEKEDDLQRTLAEALLFQFADGGGGEARRLLVGRELDFMSRGLRHHLLETCALTGERFPEYDEWLATEKAEKAEHRNRVKELEGDPAGLLLFALEKLAGKKRPDVPAAKPPLPTFPAVRPVSRPLPPAAKPNVGRNDPCPCRSGKKFKNCCMKKQNGY